MNTFSKIICAAVGATVLQAVVVRQEDGKAAPQAIAAVQNIGDIVYAAAAAAARNQGATEERAMAAGEAAKGVFGGMPPADLPADAASGGEGSGEGSGAVADAAGEAGGGGGQGTAEGSQQGAGAEGGGETGETGPASEFVDAGGQAPADEGPSSGGEAPVDTAAPTDTAVDAGTSSNGGETEQVPADGSGEEATAASVEISTGSETIPADPSGEEVAVSGETTSAEAPVNGSEEGTDGGETFLGTAPSDASEDVSGAAASESDAGSDNTGAVAAASAVGGAAVAAGAAAAVVSSDSTSDADAETVKADESTEADAEAAETDAGTDAVTMSATESPTPTGGGIIADKEDEEADTRVDENDEDDDSSVCFPGAATVELQNGSRVKMSDVSVGDMVKVGVNKFSRVFMFTHKMADTSNSFVELKTASGAELSLTSGHYLYINGALGAAQTVQAGDELRLGNGDVSAVVYVGSAKHSGLFNPQTVSGNIVVDGVLASTYTTAVEPVFAHAILSPFRMLANLGLSFTSLKSGGGTLAEMAPRGQLLF